MKLDIENFNVRRSNPYLAGTIGLAPGEERYVAKAQGLIGLEIFEGDKISIKNIEGQQECEIAAFQKGGKKCYPAAGHPPLLLNRPERCQKCRFWTPQMSGKSWRLSSRATTSVYSDINFVGLELNGVTRSFARWFGSVRRIAAFFPDGGYGQPFGMAAASPRLSLEGDKKTLERSALKERVGGRWSFVRKAPFSWNG